MEALAEPPELLRTARGAREGSLGGWEGGLPSHASPQAGPVAKDEFVYSQETRLPASRERAFFYRGLEGLESERAGQPKPQ